MGSPQVGPVSEPGATDSDPVSVDASTMGRNRSMQQSEAQQLERCKKAVEQCRADLADLRAAAKGANAHREKCAELLGAATEAVVALEDILYDQNVDLRGLRTLKQLSGRVQSSMDQGEAVVKVYGTMSGLMKLASKVCSPGLPLKFADVTTALTNLAIQARLVRAQPPPMAALPAGRMLTGSSTALDGMLMSSSAGAHSSQPPGMTAHASGLTVSPSSANSPVSGAVSGATQLGGTEPSGGQYLAAELPTPAPSVPARALQDSAVVWGDRTVPEEALQETRIHKGGGKKQMVTAMVHVPAGQDRPGHLGHLWYFLAKTFGTSTLMIWDLSARVLTEVRDGRQGSDMTCMHYDDGVIWSGHRSGGIRVWDVVQQECLISSTFKGFNTPVSAITTDENGLCWAGSDKGRVRCFRLHQEMHTNVLLGFQIVLRGELLTTDKGVPRPPQNSVELTEEGFVRHPLLRENAHLGPVHSIAAAAGRVWTWGGSPAFVSFKEWFQDGWPHGKIGGQVVRSAGLANDMVFVTPVALVKAAMQLQSQGLPAVASDPASSVLSSFTAAASAPVTGRAPTTQQGEIKMAWQMLTAHNDGMVQVWGIVNETLTPLVRLGSRAAPILRIVICESLGAMATAHSDGTLRLWELAHPRSVGGFQVFLQNEEQKTRASTMPFASLQISRSGLADALGGVLGVVTASCSASIKHLPAQELRNAAKKARLRVLGDLASNDPSQWPVKRLNSWQVAQACVQLDQQDSLDLMEAAGAMAQMQVDHDRDMSDTQERLALSGDANSWIIDWKDLSRSRVIGEGAFGKVWLGRWQETDVAIKQLGSLSALGVQTGSLMHDSSGGLKLDLDVQRALDKEVGLLKNMRHPNIILFMGVVLEPPAVVTEFCSRGSLYDLLKEACDKPTLAKALTWERRIVMALDAAKGMLYLHGHKPQPIIHRDLKSPNLLVEKNWRVKVTDFNLSRQAKTHSEIASVQSVVANNPRWQPPEVIMHQQYNKTTDVYAFGLIMWELLTWQMPFPNLSSFQIILAVTQQGQRPAVKDQWAAAEYPGGTFCAYDEYVELMKRCWAEDPAARPSFEEIIADLRKIAEKVLRESRGLGRGNSRAPVLAGGAMMLPSGSRNFARYAAQFALPAPVAATAAGNGTAYAPAPGTPNIPPGGVTVATAAAGAAAAAAAAAAQQHQQHQQPPSPSTVASTAASTAGGGTQYSETGTPPTSATTSGSYMMPGAPSGGSVMSTAPLPPSPFGASTASASVVSSNAVISGGPFGSGPAPWMQQAGGGGVSSAGQPPPSPFGSAAVAAAAPQIVSSAAAPPPSPFGGAAAGPQIVSSAAPPPPSPFGGGAPAAAAAAAGGGQTISSAAPPPPSPFGDAPAARGQTVSSAGPPPPSPFGSAAAVPQTISSAAAPPPSPFGSAAAGPQVVRSAAPPPPSPFGDVPAAAAAARGGQTISSAAAPPPSPFGSDVVAPVAPQIISSAAPPPPSPFGSAAPQIMSSAAPPPPFSGGGVPAAARAQPAQPPSPFDVHLPQDVPEPRQNIHDMPSGMPSTVMEASASVEAAAAAAGDGPPQEATAAGAGSPSTAPPAGSA